MTTLMTRSVLAAGLALVAWAGRPARADFTVIDFPGAALTIAHGINDRGQVAGTYTDATSGIQRGFVKDGVTRG